MIMPNINNKNINRCHQNNKNNIQIKDIFKKHLVNNIMVDKWLHSNKKIKIINNNINNPKIIQIIHKNSNFKTINNNNNIINRHNNNHNKNKILDTKMFNLLLKSLINFSINNNNKIKIKVMRIKKKIKLHNNQLNQPVMRDKFLLIHKTNNYYNKSKPNKEECNQQILQ